MKDKINFAVEILKLYSLWEQTDKETIVDNIEKYLYEQHPECKTHKVKMEFLIDMSGSRKDTVYAWINRSRKTVKVPFLKLCRIAKALELDIQDMLYKEE